MVLNISLLMVFVLNHLILTERLMEHVNLPVVQKAHLQFHHILMFLQDQPRDLKLLVTNNQYPLLLMLQLGLHILVVYFRAVEQILIMVLYLLVIVTLIGSLETLGDHLGEKVDILDLPLEIPAVLLILHHIQMFD